jgi:hypothetical protein
MWAEPQGGLEMANCKFRLPHPQPEPTTCYPTASEAWVERQRTVDQFDGGMNVFAKISESGGSPPEDTRVVTGDLKRLTGEIDPLAAA